MLGLGYGRLGHHFAVHMVLLMGIGLVACALQVSAADWPEFPSPEDSRLRVVGEDLSINGLPTRIWELSSPKAPEEILAYYQEQWQQPVAPGAPGFLEQTVGEWQIISRAEEPYLYTVQVAEAAVGTTFGFLSVSQPLQLEGHKPEAFAKPAGSEVLLDLASDDQGKRGRVVQFKNRQSIESNYQFYKKRYLAKGWVELSQLPPDRNKALLLMNKGGGRVSVVLNQVNNESYGLVVESYD